MLRFLASARSSGYRRLSHGDVDLCYRLLLDRPADPDALAHYRHKARANGMSILDLVGELLGSPEYSMVARRRLATPISTVVDAGDFRIHVLPGDHAVGQALAATSTYEKEVSDTIVGVLRPGAVFLDIGANYGWHTLLAATSVGPTGRAIAVEPNPANAELLRRSVVENGLENVTVVVSAAGQHEGIGGLETDGSNGRIIDLDGDLREAVACSYVVPVRPVDKIVEQTDLARVDVVKIDVEGLESAVLAGAAGTIARDHPVIVTEFFPRALDWTGGVEPRSYLQQLRSMGYRLSVIGGEPSVTDDRIMDLSSHTDHLDLLAVPD